VLELDLRQIKGLEIAKQKQVTKTENGFSVKSQSGNGVYTVNEEFECSCPDCAGRHNTCKHAYAVRYYLQREQETPQGVKSQRVRLTYPQAWRAYTQAQNEEVNAFDSLLRDLVQKIAAVHWKRGGIKLFNYAFLNNCFFKGEKMKDLLNRIRSEDCIAFMKRLPEGFIDVVVTSPPYNIGKEYSTYKDDKTREDYLNWLEQIAVESKRVLKPNGSFFLNVGGKPSDLVIPYDVENRFRKHYCLQNDIIWVKSISITKEDVGKSNGLKNDFSIGHFKPINSKRFLNNCHENIFHFTKTCDAELDKLAIGVPYQDKTNIERWNGKQDKRDRGDCWFIPYETVQESKLHPAAFPTKLPFMCIKLHGVTKDLVVYDPFMGSGSTALACLDLGVNFVGTEIDANYVKIANERLNDKKAQLKL
jgi:site-specific DNA-methyltransferase (adenine-specific)